VRVEHDDRRRPGNARDLDPPAIDWIARLNARAAIDDASPSWSRASSYAGSIASRERVVELVEEDASTPRRARRAGTAAPERVATALHFSARSSRFSARRFQRLIPECAE
jgi:hypothetical protein